MSKICSVGDYIGDNFYDVIVSAIEEYAEDHIDDLDLQLNKISTVGEIGIADVDLKFVDVGDLPGTRIEFDIAVEAEIYIHEADYHYDESENRSQWFMLKCRGDLDCGLKDFEILEVGVYDRRNKHQKPMSNALVPIIYKKDLERVATEFLQKYYPEALLNPMYVDPHLLAKRMGLSVKIKSITKDFSVFGQLFFRDCETEIYDEDNDRIVVEKIMGKTILKHIFYEILGQ